MSTLEKTGQSIDAEGEGFMNVDAAYKKLQAAFSTIPSDVASYRGLKTRLKELNSFRNMSASWRYGVMVDAELFSQVTSEIDAISGRLKEMESADNTLAYRAAGPIKRLILNATGAAPKP